MPIGSGPNTDCLSRYLLPSDAGAPAMDWSKGEIMPVATFLAFMAGATSRAAGGGDKTAEEERDIWGDEAVLRFIQTHKHGKGQSAQERDRVYRRAKAYRWMGSSVLKHMPRGKMVVVPKVGEREKKLSWKHIGGWATTAFSACWTDFNKTTGGAAWGMRSYASSSPACYARG